MLAELPDIAREKRQPVQEHMTPGTTQSSVGRAVPMAMMDTTSCCKIMSPGQFHEAFVPYKGPYVECMFNVDHITRNNWNSMNTDKKQPQTTL